MIVQRESRRTGIRQLSLERVQHPVQPPLVQAQPPLDRIGQIRQTPLPRSRPTTSPPVTPATSAIDGAAGNRLNHADPNPVPSENDAIAECCASDAASAGPSDMAPGVN